MKLCFRCGPVDAVDDFWCPKCQSICTHMKDGDAESWRRERAEAARRGRVRDAAPAMLAWLRRYARNAECTCRDLGGDGLCDACEAKAIIARVDGAAP